MRDFNQRYANLFGMGGEDHQEQEGEEEDEGADPGSQADDGFSTKWGWIYHIDKVSETMRIPWQQTFELNIVEFLNTLAYTRDKAQWEKNERERWRRTH